MPVKLFSSEFFRWFFAFGCRFGSAEAESWSVLMYSGMSLSRLETLQSTPPFFQLYFFKRLILEENWLKSRIMLGKAFCGNGFIHLNIAEIHEDDIGGQK